MLIATQFTKEQLFVGHDTEPHVTTGALFAPTDAELDVQIRRLPAFQDIMTSLEKLRNSVTRNQETFVDHQVKYNQEKGSMKWDMLQLEKNSLAHENHIQLIKKQGNENKKIVEDFCMKFKRDTDDQNKDMEQKDTQITELFSSVSVQENIIRTLRLAMNHKTDDIMKIESKITDMHPYLTWPTYWDVDNKIYDRVPSCIICEARPRNVIWFPCRHVLMCEKCSTDAVRRDPGVSPKCYICPQHYVDHKVIDWRFVGKDWDRENPHDNDHQHFYLSSRFRTIE